MGIALIMVPRPSGFTDLELTIDGDTFEINGTPTFLVIASYFDAIHGDLAEIDDDFADLAADGFNGVRILPNWFRMTGNPDSATRYMAQDTLFDKDGNLRSGTLNHLLDVLDAAKDHGLIVDLTFTVETVVDCPLDNCTSGTSALTFAEYKSAIQAITTTLANGGSAYKHVMFDVQNEYDNPGNQPNDRTMDEDDIDELVEAVHAIDANRIAFASLGFGIGPSDAATMANNAEVDVAPLHEFRECDWGNDSDSRVDTMEGITAVPIYFQESPRYRTGTTDTSAWFSSAQLAKSLYEAKQAGAAAWNFHTRSSMNLNGTWNASESIYGNLHSSESSFVGTALAATLSCTNNCPTSDLATCSPPSPAPPPTALVNLRFSRKALRSPSVVANLFRILESPAVSYRFSLRAAGGR